MPANFNVLLWGDLDCVEGLVNEEPLDESEIRAVLLNLIRRVRRLEADIKSSLPKTFDADI